MPTNYTMTMSYTETWSSWNYAHPTTSTTWDAWNYAHPTTSSITVTSSSTTWDAWNGSHLTTGTSTGDTTWYAWNGGTLTHDSYLQPVPETDEQRAEREERARQRKEEAAAAKERATQLLLSVLDEAQAADFLERQEFTVEGSDGKRYLIREGRMHNVFEVDDDGKRVVEICGHVRTHIPNEDNLAAQKLALETDAPTFLRIANRWDLRRGRATIQREAA